MPYPTNLRATIQQCCKDFNSAINDKTCNGYIVNPSVPILWFGNLEEYLESPTKIVTVGINPSNHEFPNGLLGTRFNGVTSWTGKSCLSSSDMDAYCTALNSYFSYNPYKPWFNWNESALIGLNASYYSNKGKPNRAVHIDFEAPVATDPVWSPLERSDKTALKALENYFDKYFGQMMKILSPDIVIIGIKESSFRKAFPLCKGYGANLLPNNPKGGYIRVYDTCLYGKNCKVVWTRVRNTPFAGCGTQSDITDIFLSNRAQFFPFGISTSQSQFIINSNTTKTMTKINYAPLMDAIKKVVSNHSQSIHSLNNIKRIFPKHLMSKYGSGQIIYDPQDTIKYPICQASVNGIIYEIHKDGQGWHDHKSQIVDHIINNPGNLFTKDEQIELLAAIIKSGI